MSEPASNVVPVQPRPPLVAGHRPTAIVPQSMDEAYRLANAVVQSGLAPKGLETPEKAMVAILAGLEVGLTPMAALQRIAVVNGRTTIWGDGAIGLVRASGLLVAMDEHIEGEGDKRVAICEVHRKGEKHPVVRVFTVAQARQAGLWGKSGPWSQYPERMLQMRARAFALRDTFADVLGGLYIREEVEEEPQRAAVPSVAPPPPPPPAIAPPPPPPAAAAPTVAPPPPAAPRPAEVIEDTSFVDLAAGAPEQTDPATIVEDYDRELGAAQSADEFDAINEAYLPTIAGLKGELHDQAMAIRNKHEGKWN